MEGEESGGKTSKLRVIGQVFILCLGLAGGCMHVCLGNVETIDVKSSGHALLTSQCG